jgi:hypothetical protein
MSDLMRSKSTDEEHERLEQLAQQYLNSPILISQLSNRVYEKLHSDLRIQQERMGNSSTGRQ